MNMPNHINQSLKKCGNSAVPQKDQQQQTDKEVELLNSTPGYKVNKKRRKCHLMHLVSNVVGDEKDIYLDTCKSPTRMVKTSTILVIYPLLH